LRHCAAATHNLRAIGSTRVGFARVLRARRLQWRERIDERMSQKRLHVVIATDFSPSADAATGKWLRTLLPATTIIDIVHVIEAATDPALEGQTLATSAAMSGWVHTELEKRLARVGAMGYPAGVQTLRGDSAREIVRHAIERRADLIILGTHGRRGFVGRLATWVLCHAPCPVLIMGESAPGFTAP
jgi:nucleotide-binding universal stress UspA family protein